MLSSLRCIYLQQSPDHYSGEQDEAVLGAMHFAPSLPYMARRAVDTPVASLLMPALSVDGEPHSGAEIWLATGRPDYHCRHAIRYSMQGELLFGSIQLAEDDFAASSSLADEKTPLHRAADAAYREIFALLDELGFPHVLRFWNYIAHINDKTHGVERYRQFNAGRQDGFLHAARQVAGSMVPAASALGTAGGPLTVCFIASKRTAPIPVENPRQVSAYDYPPEYGLRRPTFSRASVVRSSGSDIFLLSGTASIVGHASLHHEDVVSQTSETLANIKAVLDEANRALPGRGFALNDLMYKVYVRHREHVQQIDRELRSAISAPVLYLQADICREELLLEIEGVGIRPFGAQREQQG